MTYDDWLKKDMKEYDGGRKPTSCKSFNMGRMVPPGLLYVHWHTFAEGPSLLRVVEFKQGDEVIFKAENVDIEFDGWDNARL